MNKIKQCLSAVFANDTKLNVRPTRAPIIALITWMAVMTLLLSQYLDSSVKVGYYETALFCGAGYIFSILGFVCLYHIFFHNKKTGATFLLEAILTFTCFVWAARLDLEPSQKGRLIYVTLLAFALSMISSFIIDKIVRSIKPSSGKEKLKEDDKDDENEEDPKKDSEEKTKPDKDEEDLKEAPEEEADSSEQEGSGEESSEEDTSDHRDEESEDSEKLKNQKKQTNQTKSYPAKKKKHSQRRTDHK